MRTSTDEVRVEDCGGRDGQSTHWLAEGQFATERAAPEVPLGDAGSSAADLHIAVLVRAIELEIIPRLMLAHRHPQLHQCLTLTASSAGQIGSGDVEELARLVLSPDDDVARSCVETLRQRGLTVETLCLDLLAPVARHLGELWEQDLCDFADVTLGLGRLQLVLRELSPAFGESSGRPASGRRILLLPSPGEQHTFGLVMVAELFRRAGWDVAGSGWEAGADPVVMVRQEWFDLVGFSLAAEIHLSPLGECIRSVRQAALNPHVGIMVGGPVFSQHPEYAALVEADAVASDGRQATELAERLVESKPRFAERGVRSCECQP
ncbi:cobalamin B12-binding domain-containing protein [Ramlibacter sp.]|uniref:cobalamin B12-binding domain-containing protein n=1 Tax=Ramlibacter sp. TaxID=1917967 RepID=UPI003D14D4EF